MKWRSHVRPAVALGILLTPLTAEANMYYVAPTGSMSNPGTEAQPFATFAQAQAIAAAGDTVYFRAGTYAYTSGLTTCKSTTDTINGILVDGGGTSGSPVHYWAYPGETPVFDFSGIKDSCRVTGFRVTGSWNYFKGLEVEGVPQNNMDNHESWGIWNSGSNNTYELINTHNNMGPGLFIADGGNNLVLNSDSHDNYDPMSSNGAGNNADGFGCHIGAGGTGNVFRGCRSWWNSDDGFDFIQAQEVVTVENCWSWYNGYLPETTTACSNCNGNGFKGGGYNLPPSGVPATPPSHVIENSLAFMNTASGFYANHEPVGDHFYNDTSYKNGDDFNLLGIAYKNSMDGGYPAQNVGYLRNNIAFMGTLLENATGGAVDAANNSWDLTPAVTVTTADFLSTSITGMDGPRQADGSLPCVPFLRLAAGSDLLDKGVDVGLPYTGAAPDLGAFEYGPCVEVTDAGADAASEQDGAASTGSDAATGSDATVAPPGSDASASMDASIASGSDGGTTPPGSEAGGPALTEETGNSSGCGCSTVGPVPGPGSLFALFGASGVVLGVRRRHVARRGRSRTLSAGSAGPR